MIIWVNDAESIFKIRDSPENFIWIRELKKKKVKAQIPIVMAQIPIVMAQ